MFIVILEGGIGNQLFQFVSVMIEARQVGKRVFFNPYRLCVKGSNRTFQLKKLNSKIILIPKFLMRVLQNKKILKILENWLPAFVQNDRSHNPLKSPIIFRHGYFSSYQFVKDWHKAFSELPELNRPSEKFSNLRQQIRKVNSVSIHIRRGDYLSLPEFPVLGIEYYERSINLIYSKINAPEFFIFSDEPEWVKNQPIFQLPNSTILNDNELDDLESLFLMSSCYHHIIANSTYSWWGAFLNAYPGKVVIRPSAFTCRMNSSDDDYPRDWISI